MTEVSSAGDALGETEQIPTGVSGLDRLLNGGLRKGGLHVLRGGPGAGKSVLAHQIGSHIIRSGGKVLYLTALVETHQVLMSQARTFRFFDPKTVPGSFYYASLYGVLAKGGLPATREEISRLVAHHAPSLVIVDGVHALKSASPSALEYQRFMHDMEAQSSVTGVTTLLLTHPEDGMGADPTYTIADAIFQLRSEDVRLRSVREIKVEKLRGVAHIGGWHTFTITRDGLRIFPRLESIAPGDEEYVAFDAPEPPPEKLAGFAVEGLDEMLGGGLGSPSVSLVVGTPGAGKTLLGLAFLAAGAEAGEPGLLVGFHEKPLQLLQKAESVSLPVREGIRDGKIHFLWRAPTEMLADDVAERVIALVDEHGLRRVVIDAVEDLRHAIIPQTRELFFLVALGNLLRDRGVTVILMQDLTRIVGVNFDLPMAELSATMDNVLHARYVEQSGTLRRLISVLKMRSREYDPAMRELHISSEGLRVGKPFDHSDMVLTGLGLLRGTAGS